MKHPQIALLVIIFSIISVSTAMASVVKGILVDESLNEGEPFATVRIFRGSPDGEALHSILTSVDGSFSQEITRKGDYTFVFSSLGKKDLTRSLFVDGNADIDLGQLYISTDATIMSDVVVVGQKPLVKMETDKMTYNVADDAQAKTNTVLDMLRKVPMVTVDGEDNITVNGSSSFQVYVDGKPSLLFSGNPSQIFKSMPASAVQSIEVVTNPGARFDAEGTGGVLNLVMDRQAGNVPGGNAYNASVSARGGSKDFGGNFFINARTGKLTTSLNMIYNQIRPGNSTISSERASQNENVTSISKNNIRMPFAMGNLSIGYDPDSLTTLGATFAINNFRIKSPGNMFTEISSPDMNFSYNNNSQNRINRLSINGSIDFSRDFGRNRKNQISASYQIQHDKNKNFTSSDFDGATQSFIDLTDRSADNRENTTLHILQADFTSRINASSNISAGAKLSFRNANSDATYLLNGSPDIDNSPKYDNKNTIAAIYGEYSFSKNSLGAKGGLRYEHTWQDVRYRAGNGSDFSNSYGILVPSASLSYTMSPSSNIGINYNMRISRPGISYLNPYVDRSNPTALTYGNPDLDVEKSQYVGLAYNMFTSKLLINLTLSDNYTGNGIEQYSFMDGNMLNTTYGNIVRRNRTGLNAYINWMPRSNTRLFLNGDVNYTDIRSSRLKLHNSGWQASAMLGVQQTLPAEIKLGAFLMASTKNHTLQGWSSGFQMLSLNLSRSFLDNNLNITVSATTGLSKKGRMEIESFSANRDFSNHTRMSVPMAGFSIGVSYTFGNAGNIKTHTTRRSGNDFLEQKSGMEQIASPQGNDTNNIPAGM